MVEHDRGLVSQLAPRTGIIADAYVPFRWKPALRPTFCARTLEKKKKTTVPRIIPDFSRRLATRN